MISQALLQSLVILLPLGVSAAPPAQPTSGGPATQTVEVTAAAASGQNGLQAGAPNANVMANNVVVNATVYPIDINEWDNAWAANTNSTLLNAPNGVVDTSISVEQGDDVSDLSSDLPDCQGRLPGDPDYDALDGCAYPEQGSGGSWEPDQPSNSTGGFPDCQFRFPEDPGYDANDECARGDKFPDLPANSSDPELAGDPSSNFTGGNFSLTAPGMYPDCQDRYPGEPGYDPNDECATGGGSGGGSGGGAGQYPDCQGRYPGEPGYDAYDDCATGGQGGGGQRSTRYHLEYNIGGRSAVTLVIDGDTKTLDSDIEVWVLNHFKVISLKGNLGSGIDTSWTTPVSQGKVDIKMDDDKPKCRDELDFAMDLYLRVLAWKKVHVAIPNRQIADFPYKRGNQCKYDPSQDPETQTTEPPSVATTANTATS